MKSTVLRIALLQQQITASVDDNIEMHLASIKQAVQQKAQLVVLPELHNTRYFCQQENMDYFNLAESIPGPTTETFCKLARQHRIVIVASLFERRAAGLYHNTAVVIDSDGTIAGIYRKMHIPDDPGYYEKYYFTPGDLGFKPIQTSLGKLGVLVCWDQWYPEAARLMSLAGAQLLIYPTAIGWEPTDPDFEKQRQLQAWITIQRSHAIANGIPVLSCNRVGIETSTASDNQQIHFWGNSFACDSFGYILAQANNQHAESVMIDIDFQQTEVSRKMWPFMRDRRIDEYRGLLERWLD
ncbi:MAG: carbon-nitrogen hydrolase [Gammaproteobacteria bacterium]